MNIRNLVTILIPFILGLSILLPLNANELVVYTAPKAIKKALPKYPRAAANRFVEGYVVLSFMVGPDGKIFEPQVVDKTGGRYSTDFEKAALKALKKTTYTPAQTDGNQVQGSSRLKYIFRMYQHKEGATKQFVNLYRKVKPEIATGDQDNAKKALERLAKIGGRSHYEQAFLNLARSSYEARFGDSPSQMLYLNRALAYEGYGEKARFLTPDMSLAARRILLKLQIDNGFFAEALETYENMEADDVDGAKIFVTTIESIKEAKLNDTAYSVPGRIDPTGSWSIDLFKNSFSVDLQSGVVSELKLRCKNHYVFFEHIEDKDYHVPESWGQCGLQILGQENTSFEIVQLTKISD